MPPVRQTLFDLFGEFTAVWPSGLVRERTGHIVGPTPSPAVWLGALNTSVRVHNVRTGALADRVALEAELTVEPGLGFAGYPEGWPFVIVSMPDVEFRIKPYGGSGRATRMLASVGDSGVELVLEELPVEIRLPIGLVEPHPQDLGPGGVTEVPVGSFTPGNLDDLKVIYRRNAPTSILVHVRLHINDAGNFHLQPAIPVSFGRCALSNIPCLAVHDFRLMPSPELVPDEYEWVRHSVMPWMPSMTGPYDGLFSARTVHIDIDSPTLTDVRSALDRRTASFHAQAEFVLDDLVVPFFGPLGLPVPRHATVGVRRRVLDPSSVEQIYAFDRAPLHIRFADRWALIVESLFYRSQPAEAIAQDLGLTFSAAIVWGAEESPQHAFELGLEEDYTIVVGYQRGFGADGLPAPGTGAQNLINALMHWEIAGSVLIDIMGVRGGFSLGRRFGAGKSVGDSLLIIGDVFVSVPPTGSDDAFFRLRSLNGEKVTFGVEGVGWRFGSMHLEGLSMPDGVVAYFGPVGLIMSEIGLKAEEGASYLSISGGLMVKLPSGASGGLTVRRLRFRVAGDRSRPAFKLDGFFLVIRIPPTVEIEAGGYFVQEQVGDTRVREFGLTGTVKLELSARSYTFGLDLIVGNRTSPGAAFDYFMFQAFFRGQLGPIGYFELTGARVLFANNMLPKLEPLDRESRDLRYYSWYRNSNPLVVAGDRRMASWRADRGSWAFGIGAGASVSGLGKVFELSVFVLGLGGPNEGGFLIVGEAYVLSSNKPVGFLALEWDGESDRFSMVIGVDARLSSFLEGAPAWIDNMGSLTGTLFISNDPGTFAIGRLSDQATWLTLRFPIPLWLPTFASIGLCVEIVEDGPKGFGFFARIDGGIDAGVLALTYDAGLGVVVLIFTTGSTDFSAVIWIEAGVRVVLFAFLRLGVSARAEFRSVGRRPSRGELSMELRLETPWWLPDVTWPLEVVFGRLAAADLATATQPLRSAGATEPGTRKQLPTHLERFDPSWNGEGIAPLHSVNALRAPTRAEAARLANLAADAELQPVATDATIAIVWSVAVNDRLGLGSGMASTLGDQRSGDLTLVYDLVGIEVRRRERFGADASWRSLEERVELGPDFSDPSGVRLDGAFGPQVLTKLWDVDVRVAGQPAPKKLLLNAVAPYEFTTSDPEADEELVRRHPSWPCCERPDGKALLSMLHQVDWRGRPAGASLAAPSTFSGSDSTLRFTGPAWAHGTLLGGLPAGTMVADVELAASGVVARADLDEDAAFCWVRWAWSRRARATLVAFDGAGKEVGRKDLGPGTDSHQVAFLPGSGPIRRLELRVVAAGALPTTHVAVVREPRVGALVEVDWVAYLGLRDALDLLIAGEACDEDVPGGPQGYEGRGKLAFLPNHEYEVKLTTRVSVAHPSTPSTAASVDEFVYFRTKGLPGLNAVDRVGKELDVYVRSAYAGGRGGLVYREEPVTLAFSEGFHVAVPLAIRPPGTEDEQTTLLRMMLLVTPDVPIGSGTAFTVTEPDWIVEHRASTPLPVVGDWSAVLSASATYASAMLSADPHRERLAVVTQRPAVTCDLADPRRVVGTVLVAPPQGEPNLAASPPGSGEIWVGATRFRAVVRAAGAGFVDRRPFAAGDETAFDFATGSGTGSAAAWSVVDGELRVEGAGRRFAIFGESDWDHLSVVASIAPGSTSAGVGFGLAQGAGVPRGLFARVETSGGAARLVIRRRDGSGAMVEVDAATLPAGSVGTDPVALEVTAFDDRLRASIGETVVEVDRGEYRAGRLCLTSDGPAAFRFLQVEGLEMYAFGFATSRFRSFAEHVGSWEGRLDEIAPDALGSGTTTATVAALWSATAAEVTTVMARNAPSAERERVFARWVADLGLPLKDDVTRLELSRITQGGTTRALLIESPEPLDFAEEVTATLVLRRIVGPTVVTPPTGDVLAVSRPSARARRRRRGGEELAERLERLVASPLAPSPGNGGALPPIAEAIRDAVPTSRGLRLELDPALAGAGELVAVSVETDGPRVHRGRVRAVAGTGSAWLDAETVEPFGEGAALRGALAEGLADAAVGSILVATPDLARVLGFLGWTVEDVPIGVRVIASGDARRAIVVPVGEAGAATLSPGRYHLTLRLERKRWETTDPADDLNAYVGEGTLSLAL